MEARGIGSWLTCRKRLTPDREAVVDGERRVSYRQLNRRVNRLAAGLQSFGLQSGDRVAMLAYNRLEFIELILATAKLGLVLVPLNWRLTAEELEFNLKDSGTRVLVFDPGLEALAGAVSERVAFRHRLVLGTKPLAGASAYEPLLAGQSEQEPVPDRAVGLDTPHIIMYTAGTTGRPKGAILSQGASFWNALNLGLALDFSSQDRNLLLLPMFHIGGIGLFTLPMLYQGGTVVVQRSFDPEHTLKRLRSERITLVFGVPAIFLALIQHPGFDPEAFRHVRVVMSGGAFLPVALVRQYHEAGILLQQGFGMSEAGPSIATLAKDLALEKAGSIGRALFHLEAKIVDDAMRELAPDQVGELVIRGPNLMQGYWNRPEATREAFHGGWFHTGDLARMDSDGDLFIVERKKDMFISGGENVYPAEVENLIYELPGVAETAVIGVPDPRWGESGLAVVVPKPGRKLEAAAILHHLSGRLARFKIPKRVVFSNQLPRNAAGKVLKNVLREHYA